MKFSSSSSHDSSLRHDDFNSSSIDEKKFDDMDKNNNVLNCAFVAINFENFFNAHEMKDQGTESMDPIKWCVDHNANHTNNSQEFNQLHYYKSRQLGFSCCLYSQHPC